MERTGAVRPMRAEDLESVARLEQTCFSESWSENLLRSGLDNRLDSYLVYEELGTVLGYCVLRTLADRQEINGVHGSGCQNEGGPGGGFGGAREQRKRPKAL